MDSNLLNFLLSANLLIKIVSLITIFFYVIFTIVVFTQIKVMTRILNVPHAETTLKTISVINITLAISLFIFALVIL